MKVVQSSQSDLSNSLRVCLEHRTIPSSSLPRSLQAMLPTWSVILAFGSRALSGLQAESVHSVSPVADFCRDLHIVVRIRIEPYERESPHCLSTMSHRFEDVRHKIVHTNDLAPRTL